MKNKGHLLTPCFFQVEAVNDIPQPRNILVGNPPIFSLGTAGPNFNPARDPTDWARKLVLCVFFTSVTVW